MHAFCGEVINLITTASDKSCVLDPAPIFIVKECPQPYAPFILLLSNRSISESDLPPSQKAAIVTPIAKKSGLDKSDLKNFRPVSNLTLHSKLLELAISRQLTDFFDTNNLYPVGQSAYTKFYSTRSDGNVVFLGLLDLNAAFDSGPSYLTAAARIIIRHRLFIIGVD